MTNLKFRNLEIYERFNFLCNKLKNHDDKKYILYNNNRMQTLSYYALIKWLDNEIITHEKEPEFFIEQLFKEHLLFRQKDFLSESSSEEEIQEL